MSTHRYERVPILDGSPSEDTTYYSGIPNTAPPSFHSVALSASDFPLKNNSTTTTTTLVPSLLERSETEDPPISIWAPSESASADLEAQREYTIVRLMDRVNELERRLDSEMPNKEAEIESKSREMVWRERCEYWGLQVLVTLFVLVFFVGGFAVILIWVMARYRAAGYPVVKAD